jgi:hypothetical protein
MGWTSFDMANEKDIQWPVIMFTVMNRAVRRSPMIEEEVLGMETWEHGVHQGGARS